MLFINILPYVWKSSTEDQLKIQYRSWEYSNTFHLNIVDISLLIYMNKVTEYVKLAQYLNL